MKEEFLDRFDDWVLDMLVYDRKNDEELPRETVKMLIQTEQVSIEEMVNQFRSSLTKVVGEL